MMLIANRIGEDYCFNTNTANSMTKPPLVTAHVRPVQISQILPHYWHLWVVTLPDTRPVN